MWFDFKNSFFFNLNSLEIERNSPIVQNLFSIDLKVIRKEIWRKRMESDILFRSFWVTVPEIINFINTKSNHVKSNLWS